MAKYPNLAGDWIPSFSVIAAPSSEEDPILRIVEIESIATPFYSGASFLKIVD